MTFSNFAHLLKPVIGGSDNTVEFTVKLFTAIIGEDNFPIIEDIGNSSFKAYYNGKSSINGIARKISPVADLENFVSFLDNFGDSVSEKLCEAFSGYIKEIDLQNVNYKIASCFDEIIKKASATQRKSPSNNDEQLNIPIEHTATSNPYTEKDNKLLAEFNADYEEIVLTLIGGDYAAHLVDMSIPNQIKKLYQEKWEEKSNDFINPTLKSDIFGILGTLDELSTSFISCNSNTSVIKSQRIKIRNLYVKLHPEKYDKNIPYDVLLDDWNDSDF